MQMDGSNPEGPSLELDIETPLEADNGVAAPQEEEIKSRVNDVGEFFTQLKKGIKTIGLYRHNTQQYKTYLQHAYNSLTETLEKYEVIQLTVEQSTFKYLKNVIYQAEAAEQNFAFRFYRDGVRLLVFRKGLTSEELLNFVLICLSSSRTSEGSQEDVISLLWKRWVSISALKVVRHEITRVRNRCSMALAIALPSLVLLPRLQKKSCAC